MATETATPVRLVPEETETQELMAETEVQIPATALRTEMERYQETEQSIATVPQTAATAVQGMAEALAHTGETEARTPAIPCTGRPLKVPETQVVIRPRHPEIFLAVQTGTLIPALLTGAAVHIQTAEVHIPAAGHPALHTPAALVQAADTQAADIPAAEIAEVAEAIRAALLPGGKSNG